MELQEAENVDTYNKLVPVATVTHLILLERQAHKVRSFLGGLH